MNSENIKDHEFKKGQSGNPSGRPRGSKNVSTQIEKLLKRIAPDAVIDTPILKNYCGHLKRVTNADAIAARMVYEASIGNMKAAKELNDRVEGKPRQAVDLSGGGGGPVEIVYRVVYEDE